VKIFAVLKLPTWNPYCYCRLKRETDLSKHLPTFILALPGKKKTMNVQLITVGLPFLELKF
jgi:hypothetical protein